jgi:hypothetical protein
MRKLLLSIGFLMIFLSSFGTGQISDLLIIGKDTIHLKSFPMEQLISKEKLSPFIIGNQFILSSACMRGYQAIWIIKNDSLYLQEIRGCFSDESIDYSVILEYFKENGLEPQINQGKILASWYTAVLVPYHQSYNNKVYLEESFGTDTKKTILKFETGILILNEIKKE